MRLLKCFLNMFGRSVGYDDAIDMLSSVFAVKSIFLSSITLIISFTISLIVFFECYVYSPIAGFFIFIIAVIAESIFGTIANMRIDGEKFDLSKCLRIVPKVVSHSFFLSLAWNISNTEPMLSWLTPTVWIYLTTMNYLKALRDAGKLKWIQGSFVEFLEKQFSDRNLIEKK